MSRNPSSNDQVALVEGDDSPVVSLKSHSLKNALQCDESTQDSMAVLAEHALFSTDLSTFL